MAAYSSKVAQPRASPIISTPRPVGVAHLPVGSVARVSTDDRDWVTDVVEERKGLAPITPSAIVASVPPLIPADLPKSVHRQMLAARHGMVHRGSGGGWENYTVRIVAVVAPPTSSNVIAVSYLCDPSSLPFTEWSTFAALFDEVKVVGFELSLMLQNAAGATTTALQYGGIGAFTRTTSTPATLASVMVSPNSCLIAPNAVVPVKLKMNVPRDILFASTASPGGIPSAGCPGSIQVYAEALGATVTPFVGVLTGHYHLRGRL